MQLDCEREGYPCSLNEVPEDIREASRIALESAYDALLAGTMDDAVAVLEARDDLAELAHDGRLLRFRLEGGGPTFLQDITGITPTEPIRTETSALSAFTSPASTIPVPSNTTNAVVGDDENGDGSKDQRDRKSALFLSPYKWDFGFYDEGEILSSNLNATPPYEGRVDYVENPTESSQNVTLEDWRSWHLYDFIYVSTHGQRVEIDSTTYALISSGVFADFALLDYPVGAYIGKKYDSEAKQANRFIELLLTTDFFQATYGEGLDDTIVVFAACETGGAGANSLAQAIGGHDFIMFGWSEVVYSDDAFNASSALLEYLLLGLSADEALARLEADGLTVGAPYIPKPPRLPHPPPVFTRYAPNGGDQRIREVITLLDPGGHPLEDGTKLTGMVDGVPGDGQQDLLDLTVQVDGVPTDERAEFEVSFEFDGKPLAKTSDLTSAEQVGGSSYKLEIKGIPVGSDLEPGHSFELQAVVSLPEGGESRYVVTAKPMAWSMTVSGSDVAGTYGGTRANAEDPDEPLDDSSFLSLWSDETYGGDDLVYVDFNGITERFPQGTGTYSLTYNGEQGSDASISLNIDPYGATGRGFGTGDGAHMVTDGCTLDRVTVPPPAVLTITVYTQEFIQGTINGTFWGLNDDLCFETINASVEFTAVREIYQPTYSDVPVYP